MMGMCPLKNRLDQISRREQHQTRTAVENQEACSAGDRSCQIGDINADQTRLGLGLTWNFPDLPFLQSPWPEVWQIPKATLLPS